MTLHVPFHVALATAEVRHWIFNTGMWRYVAIRQLSMHDSCSTVAVHSLLLQSANCRSLGQTPNYSYSLYFCEYYSAEYGYITQPNLVRIEYAQNIQYRPIADVPTRTLVISWTGQLVNATSTSSCLLLWVFWKGSVYVPKVAYTLLPKDYVHDSQSATDSHYTYSIVYFFLLCLQKT